MQATTFDNEIAITVENAVCKAFECRVCDIIGITDTVVKKVVVFVLSTSYGYDKRMLAKKYQMSYLYVPTVIVETEYLIKTVSGFENKMNDTLKIISNA